MATEVFTIEQFKKEFTEIKSIEESWEIVEKMLRHEIFRRDLRRIAPGTDPRKDDIDNLCSKLVVGALGFLWCKGFKDDKAEFLFDLCYIPSAKRNRKILEDIATGDSSNPGFLSFHSTHQH